LRVVLDTNLYVSALWNPQGLPAQVVAAYQAGRFTLVASAPMLVEVETVLRRARFASRFGEARITELLNLLQSGAAMVSIAGTLQLCRDPKDNMVIETAVSGRADLIVSGDKDLTDAVEVTNYLAESGIRVLSVRIFISVLQLLQPDPAEQQPSE
jgi:putative PIN family toxin of toxin-antitoxin system